MASLASGHNLRTNSLVQHTRAGANDEESSNERTSHPHPIAGVGDGRLPEGSSASPRRGLECIRSTNRCVLVAASTQEDASSIHSEAACCVIGSPEVDGLLLQPDGQNEIPVRRISHRVRRQAKDIAAGHRQPDIP